MNAPPSSPPSPKPSSITIACIRRLRSRQEVVACIWVALLLTAVSALFQFWAGLGLLLPAAAYWSTLRWMDRHDAWQIPLREQGGLASDILRMLTYVLLSAAAGVILLLILTAGFCQFWIGSKPLGATLIAAVLGGLVAHYFYARSRKNPPWRTIGLVSLIAGPVCVYLLWDDATFDHPLTLAELSPPPAQADASWETTLWFTPHAGRPAPHQFASPGFPVVVSSSAPQKTVALLEENRDRIHAAWAALAPAREWVAAMNAFPVIADLMTAEDDSPWMNFKAWRLVLQTGCAEAAMLAVEGQGDDAASVLLPLIEVSRKLEPLARSSIRASVARTSQRQAIETARFVLGRARVSPAKLAALAAALDTGVGGVDGVRHLLWLDYAWNFENPYAANPEFLLPDHWANRTVAVCFRPFYSRFATANDHAAYIATLVPLAERRDLAQLTAVQNEFASGRKLAGLKNPFGNLAFIMQVPSYAKAVETYWQTEDARLALIAELRQPAKP